MRRVLVLGSTGSVGCSTLDVVRSMPDRFRVVGLAAGSRGTKLLAQAREFDCPVVGLSEPDAADAARSVPGAPEILDGPEAALELIGRTRADVVVQAIVGAAGLDSTLAALECGSLVALANKESLVMAGPLLLETARKHDATLVPVDSEHSAVFQCLRAGRTEEVERVILTASGGAFRDRPLAELAQATPDEALHHPTWKMGPRITVDSATMMNKALEVVEAVTLFGIAPEQVQVVVHPESVVHSMVEFRDGSVMAQMSRPDMRLPILFALAYPDRPQYDACRFSVRDFAKLTFQEADPARYPALEFGYRAAVDRGTAGAVLNAADEAAVQLFLEGRIPFTGIVQQVRRVYDEQITGADAGAAPTLEQILAADRSARDKVLSCLLS